MKNYICALIWFCVLVLSSGFAHGQNVMENVYNYDWAADFDPRSLAITAPKGALLKYAPTVGVPSLLQKQDNGLTTNWTVVAGGGVGTVTRIVAGTGLTGGTITTSGTVAMGTTGVVAGSYGDSSFYPTFTVNAQGQLTSAGSIASAGGANTQLSNLSGTTAVNIDLSPAGNGVQNMGTASKLWAGIYAQTIFDFNGNPTYDVTTHQAFDLGGSSSADFAGRRLFSSGPSFSSMLSYGTAGHLSVSGNAIENVVDPVNAQDAATKNYVDSLVFNRTAVTSCIVTAAPSTNLTVTSFCYRDGQFLVIDGKVEWTGTGDPGTLTLSLGSIAGSPVINTALIPGGAGTTNTLASRLGNGQIFSAGIGWFSYDPYFASTTTVIFDGGAQALDPSTFTVGSALNFSFRAPIVGF